MLSWHAFVRDILVDKGAEKGALGQGLRKPANHKYRSLLELNTELSSYVKLANLPNSSSMQYTCDMLESTMLNLLATATIIDILYHVCPPLRRNQAKRVVLRRFHDLGMLYHYLRQKIMAVKYLFGGIKMIEDAYAVVRRVLTF